jgi:hypothetical protein
MVDSFKEALNRNIDIERRNMYQYSKDEIIENESSILEKKLEEASYISPENKKKLEQSLQNLKELNLTEEQQAELDCRVKG